MDTFWVIKTINKDGTRGYVIDTPKGIMIITNGIHSDITQFKTYQDAQQFIRDKKIERKGVKAYIRDNNDLVKDEAKDGSVLRIITPDKPVYILENHKREKLFYESAKEIYYFREMGDAGSCAFSTEKECRDFVNHYKFGQSQIFMVKHNGNAENERTLIQVYGSTKNEHGTMSEPKHYEINESASPIN